MKKKLRVTAVFLLLVAAVAVMASTANAMTVTASQQRLAKEQIVFIDKSELERVTGSVLSTSGVSTFVAHFNNSAVWTQLGFSVDEAGKLTARVEQAPEQVLAALKAIAEDSGVRLKIVLPASGKVFIGFGTREGKIVDELPADYDGNPIP
ncbi:hypothetical protein [Culicoidibacter larvae]|uniref:Uncharacterized protein n=1 Tax=Culicoidibacter larvae TaxID=2579976 RepID=A0A5R8Q951_9FIRM|nr:hypothetical protein [Culicoidibacter larvae]TLG71813.1 hypothetical protein FEZ08_10420 [Culicoidibacter larvae]